ncbi:hypothetical protein [Polyangium sp. 15x6]|uniref:hypothetical protein n=1 Tax=Polyangium sp. 15x6 TaxID=3042687 RepID=UPI00249C9507|nr:hypothetical protein [Polyangium sp. 15x6]MDI3285174.1 hypothetical protein [Polyangium sp. 15x6]
MAHVLRIGPLCIITRVGIYSEERPTSHPNPFGFEYCVTLAAAHAGSYHAAVRHIESTIKQRDELGRLWREYGPGTTFLNDRAPLLMRLRDMVRGARAQVTH